MISKENGTYLAVHGIFFVFGGKEDSDAPAYCRNAMKEMTADAAVKGRRTVFRIPCEQKDRNLPDGISFVTMSDTGYSDADAAAQADIRERKNLENFCRAVKEKTGVMVWAVASACMLDRAALDAALAFYCEDSGAEVYEPAPGIFAARKQPKKRHQAPKAAAAEEAEIPAVIPEENAPAEEGREAEKPETEEKKPAEKKKPAGKKSAAKKTEKKAEKKTEKKTEKKAEAEKPAKKTAGKKKTEKTAETEEKPAKKTAAKKKKAEPEK